MANIAIKQKAVPDEFNKKPFRINAELELSPKEHSHMVRYIIERVNAGYDVHHKVYTRYTSIDKEIAGFIILEDAEKRRKDDVEKGIGPKPYDISLQTVRTQLHESITFLLGVYFPPEGPYAATSSKANQSVAKGLSVLMNQHAQEYKHYTATAKGLYDAMKYNIGMWSVDWEIKRGSEVGSDDAGQFKETKDVVISEGNSVNYLDPYNTILDPSVHPTELNEKGEFFATVEVTTEFRAKRLEAQGIYYNLERRKKDRTATTYYQEKPDILGDAVKGAGQTQDWLSWFSVNESSNVLLQDAIEFVTVRIWLPVDAFGPKFKGTKGNEDSKGYQIWIVVIANASVIVSAEPLPNAHGLLPIMITMPWDDNFSRQTQGFAEMLFPYQRFSSFQMNVHQHAQRKKLYGLTFFNQRIFPTFGNIDASGKIPFDSNDPDFDIRKAIYQVFDAPDTDNTLADIQNMDDLMQKTLPTQQAQQVASLERATKYQAAATVQAGNKRNLFLAVLIDEQSLMVGRRMQLYNILQYQKFIKVVDNEGKEIEIEPKDLRAGKFEFLISNGLRGLDKLVIQETMKEILFAILQSPTASQQIDTVALMNFMTTSMGDYTDLNQFKFENQFDALTPEQKEMAFQLLQKAMQAQEQEGVPPQ